MDEIWKRYKKTATQEMTPYVPGETDIKGVSVADGEIPEKGGMIGRDDFGSKWYVSKKFYEESYKLAETETDICSQIIEFSKRMQYKLDLNHDKDCDIMNPNGEGRGWEHCHIDWLFKRLIEEVEELKVQIESNSHKNTLNEAADVGNFAMMIFDIVRNSMLHFNENIEP